MKKKKKNEGNIWDFLAELGLGVIGASIFAELVKTDCPAVKNTLLKLSTINNYYVPKDNNKDITMQICASANC